MRPLSCVDSTLSNKALAMTSSDITDRLSRHPQLQKRIEHILDIMESSGDDLQRADEAERQIIELMRQMGHDALSGWADQRTEQAAEQGRDREDWRSAGEKNSTGTAPTV